MGWGVVCVTGCTPSVVPSTSPGLLGWCLHVRATGVGGSAILGASDVPSWMRSVCGWQTQPRVPSCSRGCLANCLSFPHTSRISSSSSSDWLMTHQWCVISFHDVTKRQKRISSDIVLNHLKVRFELTDGDGGSYQFHTDLRPLPSGRELGLFKDPAGKCQRDVNCQQS